MDATTRTQIEYLKFKPTPIYNFENLYLLYKWLLKNYQVIKEHTNMEFYMADFISDIETEGEWDEIDELDFEEKKDSLEELISCGTCCCLIGWATFIPEVSNKNITSWDDVERLFIPTIKMEYYCDNADKVRNLNQLAFDFLFGHNWSLDGKHPIKELDFAIDRIKFVLTHGIMTENFRGLRNYMGDTLYQYKRCFDDRVGSIKTMLQLTKTSFEKFRANHPELNKTLPRPTQLAST